MRHFVIYKTTVAKRGKLVEVVLERTFKTVKGMETFMNHGLRGGTIQSVIRYGTEAL